MISEPSIKLEIRIADVKDVLECLRGRSFWYLKRYPDSPSVKSYSDKLENLALAIEEQLSQFIMHEEK